MIHCVFFFFQAEDGIRDTSVTGVQTCALPISRGLQRAAPDRRRDDVASAHGGEDRAELRSSDDLGRSEERRVGKECRSRWSAEHEKKKRARTDELKA